MCVRNNKRTLEYLESKLDSYNEKILGILDGNFKTSWCAYAVFDSYNSMLQCLKTFNESTFDNCRVIWLDCSKFWRQKSNAKIMRSISNVEEEQEYLLEEYKKDGICLYASLPSDPVDTIWFNRGEKRGLYFLKKYCWNILGLLLIVFISTPAVLFSTLKTISEDNLNLDIISYIPFVDSYSNYIPTLIILAINLLLLIMIDQVAVTERHSFHHKYQYSVFSKAVVYLHLNMVLFPFLGLQETPIFKLLKFEAYHKEYFKDFSMLDSTPFFASLIIQYGVFGAIFYLLRIGEMVVFNFSPAFSHYIRTKFNTTKSWRRKPEYVFQYGYFYSQMATIFTIVVLFSSTAPIIAFLGAFYYFVRHTVDAHLLMSVHKKEIDSGVSLFKNIIPVLLFSLICYQMWMILYFYLNFQVFACYVITIMMFATFCLLFLFKSERPTIDLLKLYSRKDDDLDGNRISRFSVNNCMQAMQGDSECKIFIPYF